MPRRPARTARARAAPARRTSTTSTDWRASVRVRLHPDERRRRGLRRPRQRLRRRRRRRQPRRRRRVQHRQLGVCAAGTTALHGRRASSASANVQPAPRPATTSTTTATACSTTASTSSPIRATAAAARAAICDHAHRRVRGWPLHASPAACSAANGPRQGTARARLRVSRAPISGARRSATARTTTAMDSSIRQIRRCSCPPNFCRTAGECAGTTPTCAGAAGWDCNYTDPDVELRQRQPRASRRRRCDGKDNDCDGVADEVVPAEEHRLRRGRHVRHHPQARYLPRHRHPDLQRARRPGLALQRHHRGRDRGQRDLQQHGRRLRRSRRRAVRQRRLQRRPRRHWSAR